MTVFRRWFLICLLLVLGGGQIYAASREERAYAAAVAAFNGKFYDLAASSLTQFLQSYRKSTNAPMGVLLLAQAEFHLGRYPAAVQQLSDPVNLARAKSAGLADGYVYWRAEAQFASGDFSAAADTFLSLPNDFPDSPLGVSAVVEAAKAYGKLGQWLQADDLLERTNGLFQHAVQLDPGSEAVVSGRLLQSESKCAQQDYTAAVQILNLLNPATLKPEQDWKRARQLYRASLRLDNLDAVLAAATNLLQIARHGEGDFWRTNLADSVACHAEALEKLGRLPEAVAAWNENLTNGVSVSEQQRAILKMAELAEAQNNLTNAEAGLEGFVAKFPDAPAAGIARLKLAELHLQDFLARPAATNELIEAQTKLDQFLAVSTNGPLAGEAFLNRGWCRWFAAGLAGAAGDTNLAAQAFTDSLADFKSATEQLPLAEDLVLAKFKMGDAQFASGDFAGAQTNYQAVLTDFPALTNVVSSLADRALYQILRARLASRDTQGAEETMRTLLEKFPGSVPAESGQLLVGKGLSDFGSPERARAVFREFAAASAGSPLLPQVLFDAAQTFARETNWPAAITNYQNWLQAYPTNELRSRVEYARNWAVAQTGDEVRAFQLFTNFIGAFPGDELVPLAHWWVADHYFRLGGTNLVQAELNYELIFQNFPTNELADKARFMAGRAAMGRFSYTDASLYFVGIFTNSSCSEDWRVRAKFGYCEALRQMALSDTNNANLQLATNILSQITPMAATNVAGALAWAEMGDCNLQLGALDAATNAYAQAFTFAQMFDTPAARQLWSRAKVGLGIVLEKKADGLSAEAQKPLLDLALENYWQVFHPSDADADAFSWRKKAGLHILALAAKTITLTGDKLDQFVTDFKTTFPQLQDLPELKRLARKY